MSVLGHAWSVDLPEGRRRVEIRHGYWSGKVEIDVDGRPVHRSRPLMSFGVNRGIDVPFEVAGHAFVARIRLPENSFGVKSADYTFALTVDGEPMPGDPPMREITQRQSSVKGIELVAWASAAGAVVGLSQGGRDFPFVLAYLVAPVAVTWIAQNAKLSSNQLWIVSIAILLGWIVVVAAGLAILRG